MQKGGDQMVGTKIKENWGMDVYVGGGGGRE